MIPVPPNLSTENNSSQESAPSSEQDQTVKTVPIEVKWNIPSWMLTKPVEPHMQESPEELD